MVHGSYNIGDCACENRQEDFHNRERPNPRPGCGNAALSGCSLAHSRKDALEIVTGKAQFINDVRRPGMLHGKVLRSPFPHARILKIDTAKAETLSGVKAVLTYKNVPDWKTGIPRHVRVLDRKVRFVGDAVALVAAETEEGASEALKRIEVTYERLPAVYDVEEAFQPGAPQLYEEFPRNLVPLDVKVFGPKSLSKVVMGDVDKGFAEADFIGEGIYSYENVANPLPLEPPGVIAEWQGPEQLTVWSATQSASWHRFIMLSKMGFPDIRAISTHCGGSFGSKNYSAQPLFYAATLSKATGRPVKVMYNKEEHFGAFCLRLGSRFHGKVGIKKDGTLTAVSGEWLVDTGAFSDMAQAQVAVGCGEAQLMLRCANWNLQTKLVLTNRCPSGVVRGFGGQELESAFHPVLSLAMEQADLDPVEQGDGDHANVHRLRTIQARLLGAELPHSFCRGGSRHGHREGRSAASSRRHGRGAGH